MRPDRAEMLNQAPLDDLLVVLLRQFKRLLEAQGIALTEAEIAHITAQAAADAPPGPLALRIRPALAALVAESEAVLARWDLTFAAALVTDMDAMPGWQSTAEFLEIANDKGNAELRIAAASALLAALGDLTYRQHLLALLGHDAGEIEGVVARRVLLRQAGIDAAAPDWLDQLRAWAAAD